MRKYLVIGNPIGHSLSPLIHNHWMKKYHLVDSVYEKRKIEEKDLKNIIEEIRKEEVVGVNVTVPFKKLIIPFLDKLDFSAEETQSVNTLFKVNNKIVGYNTDRAGFGDTIREIYPRSNDSIMPLPLEGKYIFILGAGGVTSSIISALKSEGADNIILSNRTKEKVNELKKQEQILGIIIYRVPRLNHEHTIHMHARTTKINSPNTHITYQQDYFVSSRGAVF